MRVISCCLLIFWSLCAHAETRAHEFELDNGLKLIVKEDHRAPVIVSQVWYKVGSSYEHDGITGISHVLEHMMFKGTQRHAPGEFSRIVAENGGKENAFTSRDYTAYYQRLEKSRLPVSFELEADRMRNLLLQEEEFLKEVKVVMEERRLRTEDKPTSLTYERHNAVAFTNSSYRTPVIGWMEDLESLTLSDLEDWYQRWYAPNNATVVVVGDVDPEEVVALAKRYFGPLKPSGVAPVKPRGEVRQRGGRRLVVQAPAELPYLLIGYKVPVLLTAEEQWEPYALEVLAGILDGGDSARLTRTLVRGQQIAASAGAGYNLYDRQERLLLLDGTPTASHTVDELEQALVEQVNLLRKELVDSKELERVKAQVVASAVYELDSIMAQAMTIGKLETVGLDWSVDRKYVERIQAISAEQIRKVAQKYLVDERMTIAVLDPLPMDTAPAGRSGNQGGAHHVH